MKIVMIGPVYPYTSGLSYYVSLLYRQLCKDHEVTLLSYSFQYPQFLYKRPQKDFEDDSLKIDEAQYVLNTANPISCIKTAGMINNISPDLVIFQWLHPYFAPCYCMIAKRIKKARILFMCHNVFPHERFPFDRFLTKMTLSKGDHFTVHAKSDADDLYSILPDADVTVTVHPAYNFFKQKDLTKEESRKLLSIGDNTRVLLFFGLVRPYKGLKHLLDALKIIKEKDPKNSQDLLLLIAGDFSGSRPEYDEIIARHGIADLISITDGHIPISEVEKFFAACDLVVLPYEDATQSGVIQVAYSFDKPVLATRVGGLPDVVFDGETGYLVDPKRPDLIADSINDFFENDKAAALASGIEREKYRYSWDKMEKIITEFKKEK
ncbi:MAG: glycosyltransferase family 4 protein [Lachnospiraceae bacterium]|nr:glycosyltransferase family 4 protein [Lachnospiraceae bacterium]